MNMPMEPHERAEPRAMPGTARSSVVAGSVWMIVISLLLFFLPVINGLVGGAVGGYKVGGVGRALGAAVLPAVVVALGLWIIMAVAGLPGWGVLAGATGGLLIALADLGMFIGAAIGGVLSQRRYAH